VALRHKVTKGLTKPICAAICTGIGLFDSLSLLLYAFATEPNVPTPNFLTKLCVVISSVLVLSAFYIRARYTERYSIARDKNSLAPSATKKSLWFSAAFRKK
jgi:hypothetical protein